MGNLSTRCMNGSGLSMNFTPIHKKSHCIYSGQSAVTVTSYLLNITVIVSLRSAQKRYSHSAGYRLSFNNSLTAASSPFTVNGYIGNTCFTNSTVLDV